MNDLLRELAQGGNPHVWAMERAALCDLVQSRLPGIKEHKVSQPVAAMPGQVTGTPPAGVSVIPVFGVLSQWPNWLLELLGGSSTEAIGRQVDRAAADPNVKGILLVVNSQGGAVGGTPELFSKVQAAAGQKRVVALASSLMASAGYWIAAGASEIVATPSALVGSIGVLNVHVDESQALEREGLKVSLLVSQHAQNKGQGNPFEPLSDTARAAIQRDLDGFESAFHADIADGRGKAALAKIKGLKGEVVRADMAVQAGLVDRVATLDDVLADMRGGRTSSSYRADSPITPAMAMARARAVEVDMKESERRQAEQVKPVRRRW